MSHFRQGCYRGFRWAYRRLDSVIITDSKAWAYFWYIDGQTDGSNYRTMKDMQADIDNFINFETSCQN